MKFTELVSLSARQAGDTIVKHKEILINIIFPTLVTSLFLLLSLTSMVNLSDTVDEKFHLTRGVMLLETGDLRINQHHPYLFNYIAALPTKLDDDLQIPSTDQELWENADKDGLSFQMVEINGGRAQFAQNVLFWPRVLMIFIAAAFSLITYFVLLRMFGAVPAILFTALLTLDPNVIAHARLATTDIAASYTIFLATLYMYWMLKTNKYNWKHILALGGLSSIALLSKYTAAIALTPSFLILFIAEYRKQESQIKSILLSISSRLFKALKYPTLLLITIFFILTAAYKFQFAPLFDMSYGWEAKENGNIHGITESLGEGTKLAEIAEKAYRELQMPFPQYANGFYENVFKHNLFGHSSYFLGEFSDQGWVGYFPVSYLLKEPFGTLIFLFGSIVTIVATYKKKLLKLPIYIWALFAPFLIMGALSLTSSLNLGIRHIIPLFPYMYLFVAIATASLIEDNKFKKYSIIVVLLILVNILSLARAYPYYIGYFNESIGSMDNGHNYLRDSSYDWGQTELYVLDYIAENPDQLITQDRSELSLAISDYLIVKTKSLYFDPAKPSEDKQFILDKLDSGEYKIVDQVAHTYLVIEL